MVSSYAENQRNIVAFAATVLSSVLLLFFAMPAYATEEPEFQVISKIGEIELRQYSGYTVAEVTVPGPSGDAGSQAFPILAGYIFGKNKGDRKFAMTAPVTQAAVPVKMEMTAPVTQTTVPGGFLVQFVMPRNVTLANAPEPLDVRIHLREISPHRQAVIRFSGFWSAANYRSHLDQLQAALRTAKLTWSGEPIYSRYNPPFTPWFMRRNEIWLQLK